MKRIMSGFVTRPFVFSLILVFLCSWGASYAGGYTVTGPDGNTITVTDDQVSGTYEGVDYQADEDSATASADGSSASTDDDGGGGGGNAGAIIAGVVVVGVLAGVGWWWWHRTHSGPAAKLDFDQESLEKKVADATLRLTPVLVQESQELDHLAELEPGQVAGAELSLSIRF